MLGATLQVLHKWMPASWRQSHSEGTRGQLLVEERGVPLLEVCPQGFAWKCRGSRDGGPLQGRNSIALLKSQQTFQQSFQ